MKQFYSWFERESGYTLHRLRAKALPPCCAGNLEPDGRSILLPSPDTKQLEKCPLFACARCGQLYVQLPDGYAPVTSLLRYRVVNE